MRKNIKKDGNSAAASALSIFPLHIQKQELTQTGTSDIGGFRSFLNNDTSGHIYNMTFVKSWLMSPE